MPDISDESLFAYLIRHAEMVKAREYELGAYAGDGPTAEQADAFIASLRPLSEASEGFPVVVIYDIFRAAVETEMLWLFPERDTIGEPMTVGLRELQARFGKLLEQAMPEQNSKLDKYVGLAVIANAARRQVKLRGNGINWRLALARFMHWIGGGKRS